MPFVSVPWVQLNIRAVCGCCTAHGVIACADAFGVMVSRISGIVGGTLISLLVSITIYPSSATQELLEDVKEALRGLCELGNAAIQEAAIALGHVSESEAEECAPPFHGTAPSALLRQYMHHGRIIDARFKGFQTLAEPCLRGGDFKALYLVLMIVCKVTQCCR